MNIPVSIDGMIRGLAISQEKGLDLKQLVADPNVFTLLVAQREANICHLFYAFGVYCHDWYRKNAKETELLASKKKIWEAVLLFSK